MIKIQFTTQYLNFYYGIPKLVTYFYFYILSLGEYSFVVFIHFNAYISLTEVLGVILNHIF